MEVNEVIFPGRVKVGSKDTNINFGKIQMTIPYQLIEETVARYKKRQDVRDKHIRQLNSGSLLSVDTPDRVKKRLERLSQNPVAATVLAEAKVPEQAALATAVFSTEEFNQIVQERVLGQNDLMSLAYLEYALQASRSVGRIIIRNSRKRVVGYGSGFMVSPCLLLTNNHVLSNAQEAGFSLVEFNYQSGIDGQMLQSHAYELEPAKFFITNKALDYSLVAVKESSSQPLLSTFGWNRLIEEQGKVILGEYVNIIQHPEGKPKQLALRENQLVDLFDDFLHYKTDTASGSSGSPVFNDQWEVVGLHHSGVPNTDTEGNLLTIDDQVWNPSIGEDRIAWKANEGIRISSVVKDIKRQSFSESQGRLIAQMFDEKPEVTGLVVSSPVNRNGNLLESDSVTPVVASDGSVTWTIPLQVSVRLGQGAASVVPPSSGSVKTDFNDQSEPHDQVLDIDSDPELRDELKLLEQARRGVIAYYDEQSDRSDRDQYYGKLIQDADLLSKKVLFNRLKELVQTTHTKKFSYNPKAHVYPWVDLQPDLKIRSIYSNLEFEPEDIIREDLSVEQERMNRVRELMLSESLSSSVKLTEQIELLEANLPYNCEHVVPQSWFDKKEPMRGDLHHLFACEVECNSFRGNIPFYDFTDFEEAIRTNCGKSESKNFKFEPGNGKGEVARATLYFLLRYPGQINSTKNEYNSDRLDVLLKWHKAFPVTEHEKHRNAAIFKKQGNRNPLIDFPEWADKVDFSLGLG